MVRALAGAAAVLTVRYGGGFLLALAGLVLLFQVVVALYNGATFNQYYYGVCKRGAADVEKRQIGLVGGTLASAAAVAIVLGLAVYARADFIVDQGGTPWFLEINTLPGMTPTSLVPQEAAAVGMDYETLCQTIIDESLKARQGGR